MESIKERLKSKNIDTIEKSILELLESTKSNKTNLIDLFDLKNNDFKEDELIRIKELDETLENFGEKLPTDSLLNILKMTLSSITDNFYSAKIVIKLIVERNEINAQQEVVNIFKKSCHSYDPGHRWRSETVYDLLIEQFFPKFSTEILSDLLKWCHSGFLDSSFGDGMEELFVHAFCNNPDKKTEEKLFRMFKKYFEEEQERTDADSFVALVERICEKSSNKITNKLQKLKMQLVFRLPIEADLKSNKASRIEKNLSVRDRNIRQRLEKFENCF